MILYNLYKISYKISVFLYTESLVVDDVDVFSWFLNLSKIESPLIYNTIYYNRDLWYFSMFSLRDLL